MRDALSEANHYDEYDYIVVNDDFEQARMDLESIIRAKRLGRERQEQALKTLLAEL